MPVADPAAAPLAAPHAALARRASLAAAAMVSIALAGCEAPDALKAGARVPPFMGRSQAPNGAGGLPLAGGLSDVKTLRGTEPLAVDLDRLRLGAERVLAYDAAAHDPVARNRLQDYLLTRSDEVCSRHKSDILAVSAMVNASFSSVTSILGGVGAIVTGATAARVLAGSAAMSNALRADFNEQVYYNNVAAAIVRQINLQRQQKLQEMQPRRTEPVTQYSVDAAVRDVQEYHQLCSFSEGVAALATETKRPASADELRGRLDTLRTEYEKNRVLIAATEDPRTRVILVQTNDDVARMMRSLTIQLSVVQDVPTSPAPPPR